MKDQCPGILFLSAIPDGATQEGGAVTKPAGWEHMRAIRAHLAPIVRLRGEPWNEEDYAWEFQVETSGITISILVGQIMGGEEWMVLTIPVAIFGLFHRKRIRAAENLVVGAIESFLKNDGRFSDVRREPAPA